MKNIWAFIILLISSSVAVSAAAEGKSYVEESVKIIQIKDSHRQAEAWAMCAAAYDIMAEIIVDSAPAQSKQLTDLANGAEMAVLMSMVASEISKDMSPEKFQSTWNFSKISGGEIPKTMRTTLLANLESDNSEGKSKFLGDLDKTVGVCAENLDGQQAYIDIGRDLAKSGLLKTPTQ